MSTLFNLRNVYNALARRRVHDILLLRSNRCALCLDRCLPGRLCEGCEADLPWRPRSVLARPPRGLSVCHAPLLYRFPVPGLVHAGKYANDVVALQTLASLLARNVSEHLHSIDCLVPVPLSARRFLARGYNQAVILAEPLAVAAGVPLRCGLLHRVRHTLPQASLVDAAARQRNVRGAFVASGRLDGQVVGLVDDVVTTGATLAAAATALRRAGAREVLGIALASA